MIDPREALITQRVVPRTLECQMAHDALYRAWRVHRHRTRCTGREVAESAATVALAMALSLVLLLGAFGLPLRFLIMFYWELASLVAAIALGFTLATMLMAAYDRWRKRAGQHAFWAGGVPALEQLVLGDDSSAVPWRSAVRAETVAAVHAELCTLPAYTALPTHEEQVHVLIHAALYRHLYDDL
jgi:hypothetical protein